MEIATENLPAGAVSIAYEATLQAENGFPPYAWTLADGALPVGLTLNSETGVIGGTPTQEGEFAFTVQVTDDGGGTAMSGLVIDVGPAPLAIVTESLPGAALGVAYEATLQATGGNPPYVWALATGELPAGLVLDGNQISGTATAIGEFAFTVGVVDADEASAARALSITVSSAPLTVQTAELPVGQLDEAYQATLAATGGTEPYTWSITEGALPDGLALEATTGVISGTPTADGEFAITVEVTDAAEGNASVVLSITIAPEPEPLAIATDELPAGQVNESYQATLAATGGTEPYAWSITEGALPDGLALEATTGVISGTPTADGEFAITVEVTDAAEGNASVVLSITIAPEPEPLAIATDELPAGQVNESYLATLVATGGIEPYTWSITQGALPNGLALGASVGVISGTPTEDGEFAITVEVADATEATAVKAFSITVAPEPTPSVGYNIAWVSFHPADDSPTAAAAGAGFTLAPDVGYTDLLTAAGHNVTRIVTSGTPNASALNKFDLIVISRSVPSGHYQDGNAANWNAISTPTIVMGGYVIRQNRMGYTTGNTIPDTDRPVSLLVNDPAHPVFAGIDLDAANTMVNPFAGIVTFGELVQRGISVNTDPVAGAGTVLAVIATEGDPANTGMVIGEWQAGATMGNAGANVLGGHRLVFLSGSREQGITSEGAGIYDLTEDGARMLLNAVGYMAEPKTVFEQPVIEDGNITINWAGDGELETATDIDGVWTGTGNTSGSFTAPTGDGNRFYRINRGE